MGGAFGAGVRVVLWGRGHHASGALKGREEATKRRLPRRLS